MNRAPQNNAPAHPALPTDLSLLASRAGVVASVLGVAIIAALASLGSW